MIKEIIEKILALEVARRIDDTENIVIVRMFFMSTIFLMWRNKQIFKDIKKQTWNTEKYKNLLTTICRTYNFCSRKNTVSSLNPILVGTLKLRIKKESYRHSKIKSMFPKKRKSLTSVFSMATFSAKSWWNNFYRILMGKKMRGPRNTCFMFKSSRKIILIM